MEPKDRNEFREADALSQEVRGYQYLLPMAPPQLQKRVRSSFMDVSDEPPAPPVGPEYHIDETTRTLRDRARTLAPDALLGLAVGDALGAQVEFMPRGSFPHVTEMTGGGPFELEPGQWTDDTTMAVCLAESLLANRWFKRYDFADRLLAWYRDGVNSVNGRCFDIGNTTRRALERYEAGGDAYMADYAPDTAGNGSTVRVTPIAIMFRKRLADLSILAESQSSVTHEASEAEGCAKVLSMVLADGLYGGTPEEVLRRRGVVAPTHSFLAGAGEWKGKSRDEISSSGYAVHTLEAALWSVGQAESFEEAVVTAVNLGDDADSVGAVAGQVAGAIWGASAIPDRWLEKLAWRDRLTALADALFETAPVPRGRDVYAGVPPGASAA